MKWMLGLFLLALLPGCAHLRGSDTATQQRIALWTDAHLAFHAEDFRHARSTFQRLSDEYPQSDEGREALFYLGALSLDPRNPAWNPEPAVQWLRQYLALDTSRAVIHRRPEATTLLRLADQLILPEPQPRGVAGAGTAPPTEVPRTTTGRTVTTAAERRLQIEVDSLQRLLQEREEIYRRQREELERIRRVLAPRP